jgi:hypothetical protein
VGWGPAVIGETYHRSPRLSASFIARDDGPIADLALWFETSHPFPAAPAPAVSLGEVRCFDRFGDRIPLPELRLVLGEYLP